MFVPSTSDTRVNKPPEVFTNKARLEVINNLANNSVETISDKSSINNTQEINELTKSKSRTSSLLPSFLLKSDKEKNIQINNDLTIPSSPTQSSLSSLRSSVYSSLVPSYHQLMAPISRSLTRASIDSTSASSIFSSIASLKSTSTAASSISELSTNEKLSLPSISNILKSNIPENELISQQQLKKPRHDDIKNDRKTLSLERAISDIKDYNAIMHGNVGYEVFLQLNEAIAEILKTENLQLIDWNLNLIRCSLIVSELPPQWQDEIPAITVNGNTRYKVQDGFQSELVKLISSYRRQQKNYLPTSDLNFKNFIKSVMQNRFLNYEKKNDSTVIRFNKNIKEDVIRIQLLPEKCSEDEFIDFLTNSDLFKEFNLEQSFKRKVATISIKQSKFLQSLKTKGSDELLHPYKILSLRNYFLNLLVASQTLFEFHYTVNELLGKEQKGKEISNDELKWLWDNIRERNFKKIEVFDRFY